MKFSLVICTYMRPEPLLKLLNSVVKQSLYPTEILIIDGSINFETQKNLQKKSIKNLHYFKVEDKDRGLTKQRNFGIEKVANDIEIVCFLDDDTVLTENYFKKLISTYKVYPDAAGIGGYILNEVKWRKLKPNETLAYNDYQIDGYVRKLGNRHVFRKKLGLLANTKPCIMPKFSNGFSVASLPPNNKTYSVEYFMGGVSSFQKKIVDNIKFSEYFEGYGLYEDLEYCLRVSKKHQLYVNTAATLYHYHEEKGRPNKYDYGKMVVRNGWYVWRTKHPKPTIKSRFKWNAIAILLMTVRFVNVFTSKNKTASFTEFLGRKIGWLSLLFNAPKRIN